MTVSRIKNNETTKDMQEQHKAKAMRETSISRIKQWLEECDIAFLSVARDIIKDVRDPDIIDIRYLEGTELTPKDIKERLSHAKAWLRHQGYGVAKLEGVYTSNEPSSPLDREDSFMVVNLYSDPNFLERVLKLGEYMNQDAVFYHPAGANIDGVPSGYLIGTNNADIPGYHKTTEPEPIHYSASSDEPLPLLDRPISEDRKDSRKSLLKGLESYLSALASMKKLPPTRDIFLESFYSFAGGSKLNAILEMTSMSVIMGVKKEPGDSLFRDYQNRIKDIATARSATSIVRIKQWLEKYDIAFLSAARETIKDIRDPNVIDIRYPEGTELTPKDIDERLYYAKAWLNYRGYGITKLEDIYPAEKPGSPLLKEDSFMVVNLESKDTFLDDLLRLGEYMNQDAVFYHPAGTNIDGVPSGYLIGTNNADIPGYHKTTEPEPIHYSASSGEPLSRLDRPTSDDRKDSRKSLLYGLESRLSALASMKPLPPNYIIFLKNDPLYFIDNSSMRISLKSMSVIMGVEKEPIDIRFRYYQNRLKDIAKARSEPHIDRIEQQLEDESTSDIVGVEKEPVDSLFSHHKKMREKVYPARRGVMAGHVFMYYKNWLKEQYKPKPMSEGEASIAKIKQWLYLYEVAFISVARDIIKDVRNPDVIDIRYPEGTELTTKDIEERLANAKAWLSFRRYGVTKLESVYPAKEPDSPSLREDSFVVVNLESKATFLDDLLRLGEYMNQDSVFYHPKRAEIDGVPLGYLIGTNNAGYPGYHKTTEPELVHYSAYPDEPLSLLDRPTSEDRKDSRKSLFQKFESYISTLASMEKISQTRIVLIEDYYTLSPCSKLNTRLEMNSMSAIMGVGAKNRGPLLERYQKRIKEQYRKK